MESFLCRTQNYSGLYLVVSVLLGKFVGTLKNDEKMNLRSLLLGFMAVSAIFFVGCKVDDDDLHNKYYVRYRMGITPGDEIQMSYTDPDGVTTMKYKCYEGTVESVIGPVEKGFKASLSGSVNGGYGVEYLEISTSEDGKPFVTNQHVDNGLSIYYIVGE